MGGPPPRRARARHCRTPSRHHSILRAARGPAPDGARRRGGHGAAERRAGAARSGPDRRRRVRARARREARVLRSRVRPARRTRLRYLSGRLRARRHVAVGAHDLSVPGRRETPRPRADLASRRPRTRGDSAAAPRGGQARAGGGPLGRRAGGRVGLTPRVAARSQRRHTWALLARHLLPPRGGSRRRVSRFAPRGGNAGVVRGGRALASRRAAAMVDHRGGGIPRPRGALPRPLLRPRHRAPGRRCEHGIVAVVAGGAGRDRHGADPSGRRVGPRIDRANPRPVVSSGRMRLGGTRRGQRSLAVEPLRRLAGVVHLRLVARARRRDPAGASALGAPGHRDRRRHGGRIDHVGSRCRGPLAARRARCAAPRARRR